MKGLTTLLLDLLKSIETKNAPAEKSSEGNKANRAEKSTDLFSGDNDTKKVNNSGGLFDTDDNNVSNNELLDENIEDFEPEGFLTGFFSIALKVLGSMGKKKIKCLHLPLRNLFSQQWTQMA